MDRFFLSRASWEQGRLEGDEAHHCIRVMRKSVGDGVEVFDGGGRWARATITSITGDSVALERHEGGRDEPLVPQVTLCVAIPKGKTMELVVQKAVELGVARIQPLVTAHTVVKVPDAAKKQAKWQRVALEACKQCGQNVLPVVDVPLALEAWLPTRRNEAAGLVASLRDGAREFREVLRGFPSPPEKVDLLIGPEGDLTAGEIAGAEQAGFTPVTLGGIVLRVETAALYALSALRYEFGG